MVRSWRGARKLESTKWVAPSGLGDRWGGTDPGRRAPAACFALGYHRVGPSGHMGAVQVLSGGRNMRGVNRSGGRKRAKIWAGPQPPWRGVIRFGGGGLAGESRCVSRRARGERGDGRLVDHSISHVLFHGMLQPSAIFACSARESSRGAVAGGVGSVGHREVAVRVGARVRAGGMLAKRIIPCLDIAGGRVVKGVKFLELRDAGDPVEQAKRLRGPGRGRAHLPRHHRLPRAARHHRGHGRAVGGQVFMPLTVGGGIRAFATCAACSGRRGQGQRSTPPPSQPGPDQRDRAVRQPVHRARHRRAAQAGRLRLGGVYPRRAQADRAATR
jgi:hypothetical protein